MNGLVGIVGDYNAQNRTHLATNAALEGLGLRFEWVSTTDLDGNAQQQLARYDGIWIAPASPYRSMEGALLAIRYARERGVPLVGT
jgi:CTP synthase (UTP-ammonia lyase)